MEWIRGSIAPNGLAILTLDRPKALNAMNLDMDIVYKQLLDDWANNSSVKAVLVESSSPRAFSAGMDVKWVAQCVKDDIHTPLLEKVFAAEYSLICAIARYKKPYISLMNGITMGFGIGLSGHGKYRVITEKTILAMPENGIGLFPDVGFAHIAAKTPANGAIGAYLALTGARISKPSDALFLGFGTHFVPSDRLPSLKDCLLSKDLGSNASLAVEEALKDHSQDAGPPEIEGLLPAISSAFEREKSVAETVQALNKEANSSQEASVSEWAKASLAGIQKGAPFSLAVTRKHLSTVAGRPSEIEEVMKMEYRIALRAAVRPDFLEGVRAVLVDKDQTPKWQPDELEGVKDEEVESLFHALDSELQV